MCVRCQLDVAVRLTYCAHRFPFGFSAFHGPHSHLCERCYPHRARGVLSPPLDINRLAKVRLFTKVAIIFFVFLTLFEEIFTFVPEKCVFVKWEDTTNMVYG